MIFTSVDLPAPFSPSSASTEPAWASRSMPCRTSTPPNAFRIPRTSRRKGSRVLTPLAVLQVVVVVDVGGADQLVRHEQVGRDVLALRGLDQVWDTDLAVALREVGRVGDPVRIVLDLAVGRRVGTLAR